MSIMINHNITALDAWRNLTLTTSNMQKSMEKLSSGYRINRAADDPAGLVISEQFRAQVAGLNRAVTNSEGSINMVQTAEGALTEVNNLLISMRELAIHAANTGFNDANQLAADQQEIENALATIDRIGATTQFGTKKLLDGSADNVASITTANNSEVTLGASSLSAGSHSLTAAKKTDASGEFNTTNLGLSTPQYVSKLSGGTHNIDITQASSGATKSGTRIFITDNWSNALSFQASATSALIQGTITYTADSNTLATITVKINYQDTQTDASPIGVQTLSFRTATLAATNAVTANSEFINRLNTAIAANTYLAGKIVAATTSDTGFQIRAANQGNSYSVYVQSVTVAGGTNTYGGLDTTLNGNSARGISGGTVNMSAVTAATTASNKSVNIAGTYSTMSGLVTALNNALGTTFGNATSTTNTMWATAITTAAGYDAIKLYTIDQGSKWSLKVNDSKVTGSADPLKGLGLTTDSAALTGSDAYVSLDGYTNKIDDVRYWYGSSATTQLVALYNDAATNADRGSVQITVAKALTYGLVTGTNGVKVGNIKFTVNAPTYGVRLDGSPETTVTAGAEATIYNSARTESVKVKYGLDSEGGTETIQAVDQRLVFQVGANVGQTVKIALPNMKSTYLATGVTGNMFESLSRINVTTASGAQDAQTLIDKAIDTVTNARGTLGSFQKNTLESNLRNLRIASQNLTAAESTIRDTDMAKEMSEYTKDQILLQAGTAMLAQANQIPQQVLTLFR
jgi:flagellin